MNPIQTTITTPESIRNLINTQITNLVVELLNAGTPFSILISNKNWDNPLPSNLTNQDYFYVQVNEQTLEDSYYDETKVYIITKFGEQDNSITLYPEDVKAIFTLDRQQPYIFKPYNETPHMKHINLAKEIGTNPLDNFTKDELTEGVVHSVNCIVLNNPKLFGLS
jgi:hypothetical protein